MSMRKIKNAVNNTTGELIYFKGHAKATFMSDGSTVEDAINNIESNIDLSDYVKTEELEGYAKIEDIPSLEGYAKTEDIPSLNGYATEEWVNNNNYATEYELNNIEYSSIKNAPISEDETGELNITDENGNIGMKVSSEAVYAKDFIAGGHKLSEKIDKTYVDNSIAELVDGAPETLDTLNELSAALKDNADIVDVLNQSIGNKQDILISGTNVKTINGESILGEGDLTTDIVVASKEELESLDVPIGTKARIFTEIPETTYNNLNLGRILNGTETNPLPSDFSENVNYTFNIEVDTSVTFPYDETAEHIRVEIPTNYPILVYISPDYSSIKNMTIKVGYTEDLYYNYTWNSYKDSIRALDLNEIESFNGDLFMTLYTIAPAFNGYITTPATVIAEEYTKTSQGWVKTTVSEEELALFLELVAAYIPYKTSQLENDSNFVSSDNLTDNFKTINGQSIVGSGDLTIEGGSSEANVAAVDDDNSTLDDVETNNYKKEIVTINSGTITLSPDKYYKNTGTFSTLDISLEDSLDTTHISEYCLEFTTASNGTSLSVPDTIKWANGIIPDLENNCIYQLSIMNNLGICTKFI